MSPKNKKAEPAIAFTPSLGNKTRHLAGFFRQRYTLSGRSSGVEHDLAKVGVEGSNPFARSNFPNIPISGNFGNEIMEFIEAFQLLEARVLGGRLQVFERPGQFMGNENAPAAGGNGRHNV